MQIAQHFKTMLRCRHHHKSILNQSESSRSVALLHGRPSHSIFRLIVAKAGANDEVCGRAWYVHRSLRDLNDPIQAWASREKFLQEELRAARSQVDKLLDQQAVLLAMLGRMGSGNGGMPVAELGHGGGIIEQGKHAHNALLQANGQMGTETMASTAVAVVPQASDGGAGGEPLTEKAAVNVSIMRGSRTNIISVFDLSCAFGLEFEFLGYVSVAGVPS